MLSLSLSRIEVGRRVNTNTFEMPEGDDLWVGNAEMRRAGQKHMMLFGLDAMLQCWTNGQELYGTCHAGYAGSILTRVLRPGDSTPCQELASRLDAVTMECLTSAFRLPSTESGVPVRACGVELRGAGPSLVTSA